MVVSSYRCTLPFWSLDCQCIAHAWWCSADDQSGEVRGTENSNLIKLQPSWRLWAAVILLPHSSIRLRLWLRWPLHILSYGSDSRHVCQIYRAGWCWLHLKSNTNCSRECETIRFERLCVANLWIISFFREEAFNHFILQGTEFARVCKLPRYWCKCWYLSGAFIAMQGAKRGFNRRIQLFWSTGVKASSWYSKKHKHSDIFHGLSLRQLIPISLLYESNAF